MSGSIDFAAIPKCYAVMWSYGVLCVGCNCCGRVERGLAMWEARLRYHEEELERNLNFSESWQTDRKLVAIQKENVRSNVAYHRAKIRYCRKAIKRNMKKVESIYDSKL